MGLLLTRRLLLGVPLGLWLAAQLPAQAAEVTGRVVGVIDGDTIDVLTARFKTLRVRLAGVDAPELGQDFGRNAKAALSSLAFSRTATVASSKRDRYGRLVGKVLVDGRDMAFEMLVLGMAWHYRQFESEQPVAERRRYADAEVSARMARSGLRADAAPVPPWEHRGRHSPGRAP